MKRKIKESDEEEKKETNQNKITMSIHVMFAFIQYRSTFQVIKHLEAEDSPCRRCIKGFKC